MNLLEELPEDEIQERINSKYGGVNSLTTFIHHQRNQVMFLLDKNGIRYDLHLIDFSYSLRLIFQTKKLQIFLSYDIKDCSIDDVQSDFCITYRDKIDLMDSKQEKDLENCLKILKEYLILFKNET